MQLQINSLENQNEQDYKNQLKQSREKELYYREKEKTLNATILIYENKVKSLYQKNDSLQKVRDQVINQSRKKNEAINRYNSIDINNELTIIFTENNIR